MTAIIDSILIDNQAAVPITVQIEDDFVQDISNGNPAPANQSAFPFQATVPTVTTFSGDKNSLPDTKVLGNGGIICSVTDAACAIIVNYHFE
jgi:hypothetical protein